MGNLVASTSFEHLLFRAFNFGAVKQFIYWRPNKTYIYAYV